MSAIKNDPQAPLYRQVQKLGAPWNHILSSLKHMTLPPFLDLIDTAEHVDVSGVNVNGEQHTFETFASMASGGVDYALYAIYGLAVTCITGKLHPHLSAYAHEPWMVRLFSIRFHGDPIFFHVCRREMRSVAQWMLGIMRRTNVYKPLFTKNSEGETVLHIAVSKRQWEWCQWLIDQGCSPFEKNIHGRTPIMYAAPCGDTLSMFRSTSVEWFRALNDALVDGRAHPEWCNALIDAGADVNQPELLDSPLESFVVFAKRGMDMNIAEPPETSSAEHYRIMYMFGKKPSDWCTVLHAFSEPEWIRFLFDFFENDHKKVDAPQEYKENVFSRQIITQVTESIRIKLEQ